MFFPIELGKGQRRKLYVPLAFRLLPLARFYAFR